VASTITPKDREKLPDWAKSTAHQIEDLGFRWEFDWEYPVPDPGTVQRVQIRDETHVGQVSEVRKYAEAMKRGDKFPPGVVTKDGRIVDFNTRARAAERLGWPTFPAFILDVSFSTADSFSRQRLRMLGAAFNTGGPKPLTRAELTDIVREAAANPAEWDTDKVSQHLSVTRGTVAGIFAQFRAEKRAEQLGVKFNGAVPPSNRALLGQRSDKLADEPFKEITRLAQDAGLSSGDLRDLCNRTVAVTTGDADRLKLIADERVARESQITTFRAAGKRRPPLSSRVHTYVDFITGYDGNVADLIDGNPSTREDYIRKIDTAINVLTTLLRAQREASAEAVK
jgi:hypothetical protein